MESTPDEFEPEGMNLKAFFSQAFIGFTQQVKVFTLDFVLNFFAIQGD